MFEIFTHKDNDRSLYERYNTLLDLIWLTLIYQFFTQLMSFDILKLRLHFSPHFYPCELLFLFFLYSDYLIINSQPNKLKYFGKKPQHN